MKLAERMSRLGTETAFAVSAEAEAMKLSGKKIYPFHLGDMNLPTPKNIIDAAISAMKNNYTGYCSCRGIAELRSALAFDIGKARNVSYTAEDVSIQPGGKPVIGKFIMTLMNPGDEVLYPNPGYPIYESQIEFNGGKAVPYPYVEYDGGFKIDIDKLESSITPKTKILIYNNYHNPLGSESTDEEMKLLAKIAVDNNLMVLTDEAYYDMRYSGKSKSMVSLPGMKERTVILYTFSKKFAMTGWRLGAAIGPEEIIQNMSRLNVNDESCSNHFIQHAAVEALQGDQSGYHKIVEILKERRDKCVALLNSIDGVHVHKPETTFYLFPNVTAAMEKLGCKNVEQFRKEVLEKTGVSFCTRNHFGRPLPNEKGKYVRFAYSGINIDQIEEGLTKLKQFIER